MQEAERKYLEALSMRYPTPTDAALEMASLTAELSMPKETEFFVSDIHGEHAAFSHILRNASGNIRTLIDAVFGDELSAEEKASLASLVYYPAQRTAIELKATADQRLWCASALDMLIRLAGPLALRHTQQRVIDATPARYASLVQALLFHDAAHPEGDTYFNTLVAAIIEAGQAPDFIVVLAELIQHLAVDHLHMLGDVYDRGTYPDRIMEELMNFPSIDIQWGNHDVVWMGAALGQWGCIAHVVRNCARYGNLSILEDSYGINLRPLAEFAQRTYGEDPCVGYALKGDPGLSEAEHALNVKIQKAMAILQFKVEAQLIAENPSFGLESRNLLHTIDFNTGTIVLDGTEYPIVDMVMPTVDPADPYRLTPEEDQVMHALEAAFVGCEKLQRHMAFLLEVGSLYTIYNGNLLFHACVPLNPDGTLKEVEVFGETYKGRALFDVFDHYVREAFTSTDPVMRKRGKDLIWYMWLGEGSPLFAKSKMATFEIYMIADKAARKEVKNSFYSLFDQREVFDEMFRDFGLDPQTAHIVCGHVPVKVKDGEDPVKCDGKVFTIDGGYSSAYQGTTGIAGFTLIYNSYGYFLDAHQPISSTKDAIEQRLDIFSDRRVIKEAPEQIPVADTDRGALLRDQIFSLKALCE
ncbi:fructose-1,6-bisphosphatase [Anaerotardibacter muris]|uniref:fructose-1,6-bisphosphatase n=1 Tax=Anaerotardibacter muris TaxID=2941505 RepID=UPI00203F544D|nr:fructose-1,6-bisphosphatase [Anaerotardibacter muris]